MAETVLYTETPVKPAKLFVLDKTGQPREYTLASRAAIGRKGGGAEPDIAPESFVVSRSHGEIATLDEGFFYRDLDSTNGTFINNTIYGKRSKEGRKARRLENGDVLRISGGTPEVLAETVVLIFSTDYSGDWQWVWQPLSANIAEINIGRQTAGQKGIGLSEQTVSKNHASFFVAKDGWAIADHNSTNGVYVNNRKITASAYLRPYDVVRIVNRHFIFLGDRLLYQSDAQSDVRNDVIEPDKQQKEDTGGGARLVVHITERSVWQRFKKKLVLLQDIHLTVNSGEMVLILGGSGAGKTTFMNAIMGYEKAEGQILHGELDIYDDYDQMKYEIGFVPQQDLLRGSDTVYDTLSNAAEMKLPVSIDSVGRAQRISEVLELMGLYRERGSLVSKLSGGQRKRLSIAVEFIAYPGLFFLDEPDSGLDGIMARSLQENLRQIADSGKIVMVITHAPDRVADLYDKIIVLAKSVADNSGHLAFYGTINEAREFFETDTLEGVVRRINRPDEGGEGKSDFYIEKYKRQLE